MSSDMTLYLYQLIFICVVALVQGFVNLVNKGLIFDAPLCLATSDFRFALLSNIEYWDDNLSNFS